VNVTFTCKYTKAIDKDYGTVGVCRFIRLLTIFNAQKTVRLMRGPTNNIDPIFRKCTIIT
jgi:hypothetical protein